MKKLLITGFEPFDGEEINPSWEAVKRLPSEIGSFTLTKLLLPVAFGRASDTVVKAANELDPDVILCIGQAGGRSNITPELVAINLRNASIPDNDGSQPKDEPISENGPVAYFSTLPVRKMSEAIAASGIQSAVSYSAGAYVCNDVLYTLLSRFDGSRTTVGFIHIPYSDEQSKISFMNTDDIVRGLTVAIESID